MLLVNEEIFDYIDQVIDIQNSHVYCVCDRKDELLAIGTTGVNTNHPAINTLYKILSESTFTYIENGFWADFSLLYIPVKTQPTSYNGLMIYQLMTICLHHFQKRF